MDFFDVWEARLWHDYFPPTGGEWHGGVTRACLTALLLSQTPGYAASAYETSPK